MELPKFALLVYDLNVTGVTAVPMAVNSRSNGSLAVHVKLFLDVTSLAFVVMMYLSAASTRVGLLADFSSNQNCKTPGLFEENILISIFACTIRYSTKVAPKRVAKEATAVEIMGIALAINPVVTVVVNLMGFSGSQTSHIT